MAPHKGRRIAIALGVVAIAVLAAAIYACRDRLREAWYLHRLDSPDLVTSYRAARKLGELRSERALPRIVELFRACEGHDREAAAVFGVQRMDLGSFFPLIFMRIGSPAVPYMVEILKGNGKAHCRSMAAMSLGYIPPASREVILLLADRANRDRDKNVRISCLFALSSLNAKDPEAITAIEKARGDKNPSVRRMAEFAKELLGGE